METSLAFSQCENISLDLVNGPTSEVAVSGCASCEAVSAGCSLSGSSEYTSEKTSNSSFQDAHLQYTTSNLSRETGDAFIKPRALASLTDREVLDAHAALQ